VQGQSLEEACIGRPLIALFARAAKLCPRAYGTRHARARPSVMQWILAVTETVVIKASLVPFLSPYARLSLRWALTRLQASGLAESITRKERGHTASTLHTHGDTVRFA